MTHGTFLRASLSVAVLIAAGACRETPVDPVACTEIALAGINVAVTDAGTGQQLGEGSTLTLRDGAYTETTEEVISGNILAGAWERPGTYEASVDRAGYDTWVRSDVRVVLTEDECHVVPVELDAALTPSPT